MERRTFLKRTTASVCAWAELQFTSTKIAGASEALDAPENRDVSSDGYQAPEWLRFARTIYFDGYSPPIYPHIDEFDARRLVEIVAELGGDTLRFQPIGYLAYYPSKAYPVHPELGSRDLIDEVVRECRRGGLHLYCYTVCGNNDLDLGLIPAHPEYADWALRDADGKPYKMTTDFAQGSWSYVCIQGDAYREAMRKVVRELCEHDIDGAYFDSPCGYRAICFCDPCRKNYKRFSGMDLERLRNVLDLDHLPRDVDMKALIAWYEWANQLAKEDLLDYRKIIHDSHKFMLCHNGDTWVGNSLPLQYRIPDGFMVEQSVQVYQRLVTGLMDASMARPTKKLAQMYMGCYDVSQNDEPRHSKPWALHITNLEDTDEIGMQGFANLACGNAPVYCTANRLYYGIGDGTVGPAKDVFALMRRAEPILKDSVPVPYVTIVPTWESLQLWRTQRSSWDILMSEGFALAMLDERISFDVNPSTEMSKEWLKGQRVIALCGASGVRDEDARLLADWVKGGGGLLATYDTGLYDEKGEVRRGGGVLKEVLGVEMKGEPLESQANCYYRIQKTHPALGQYGKGAKVMGDSMLMPVEARAGAMVLADCWNLGTRESRGPAIIVNPYGRGRTIYISGSLEAHYTTSRVPSLRQVLGSMVRYLGGDAPMPFSLSAPRGVYGVLRQALNGDLVLWVLANLGFKDADVGMMRQEYMPVPNVEVRILVPAGRQVKSIELVRGGRSASFTMDAGYAVLTLPAVHIAEVVHLQLA